MRVKTSKKVAETPIVAFAFVKEFERMVFLASNG